MSLTYHLRIWYDAKTKSGEWQIVDQKQDDPSELLGKKIVFRFPHQSSHWLLAEPPIEVRTEYERLLTERNEWPPLKIAQLADMEKLLEEGEGRNIVELCSDEEQAMDQPCLYGNRVGDYAVYCHNDRWLYAPRKCRRDSRPESEWKHCDCPGYKENSRLVGKEVEAKKD